MSSLVERPYRAGGTVKRSRGDRRRRPDLWRRWRRRGALPVLAATSALLSCMDATDVELIEVMATGTVQGAAYVDLNGTLTLDEQDRPLVNVTVALQPVGAASPFDETVTDQLGAFTFRDVPVGTYEIALPDDVLGDSLVSVVNGAPSVTVVRQQTLQVDVGASFPELTLAEVRTAEPGRRVFTAGIALNPRPSPDPLGQVHFESEGTFLRALDVERGPLQVGDSVRLLGRTAVDNGQPVLTGVTPVVLVAAAEVPMIEDLTTAEADDAAGGALDAALVRIRAADITDTATVNGDFRFLADDGTGSVEVVLRGFLGLNTSAIDPESVRVQRAVGLLTPIDEAGTIRWRLLPREGGDVVLEPKVAEVEVTTASVPVAATTSDMVEVVVSNDGR